MKVELFTKLIRKARELEAIRARLILTQQGGFTELGRDEILKEAKEAIRRGGYRFSENAERNCNPACKRPSLTPNTFKQIAQDQSDEPRCTCSITPIRA